MSNQTANPQQPRAGISSQSGGGCPYVYRVIIEPDEDRYFAKIPTLPGCYSWGYTFEEAFENVKEAVELWLEVKREEGEPIPIEDANTIRAAKLTVGVMA
ncbi:MAG TPA: type II toxin-antitoxin system HicB family antitoxin [Blastocatellia bacterium]